MRGRRKLNFSLSSAYFLFPRCLFSLPFSEPFCTNWVHTTGPLKNAVNRFLMRPFLQHSGDGSHSSLLPVNIANGAINISMGKMLPSQAGAAVASSIPKMSSMTPSLSLPKMPGVPGLGGSGATTRYIDRKYAN